MVNLDCLRRSKSTGEIAGRCYPDNPWFVRVCSVLICILGCIG